MFSIKLLNEIFVFDAPASKLIARLSAILIKILWLIVLPLLSSPLVSWLAFILRKLASPM